MKILIPFSGGVNSTYIAEKWLRETDHEIIALHINEGEAQLAATQNIYAWLKDNRRNFTLIEPMLSPVESVQLPVRVGFTQMRELGKGKAKRATVCLAAKNLNVDAVVWGASLENTHSDAWFYFQDMWKDLGIDVYIAGCREWQTAPSYENYPKGLERSDLFDNMMGRFEQYEALPSALRSLVYRCKCGDLDKCIPCGYWDAYEHSGMTGREFDLLMAEKTCAGPWRDKADPKIYMWRNNIGRILMEMREER